MRMPRPVMMSRRSRGQLRIPKWPLQAASQDDDETDRDLMFRTSTGHGEGPRSSYTSKAASYCYPTGYLRPSTSS